MFTNEYSHSGFRYVTPVFFFNNFLIKGLLIGNWSFIGLSIYLHLAPNSFKFFVFLAQNSLCTYYHVLLRMSALLVNQSVYESRFGVER